MQTIPHDDRYHVFKSEEARRAFTIAFSGLFEDLAEYLKLSPSVLYTLCARGPHLNAQAWKEVMKQGIDLNSAYRTHMDTYFYDLLFFNGIYQQARPRTAAVLEAAAALAEGPVADFGSGLGSVALFFGLMGREVTSLEINASLQEFQRWRFARHGRPAPRFEPLPDHSYSLLFCTDVIEHLEDPKGWVPFAHRMLRPDGRLYLTHYFCKADSEGEYPMHLDDIDEVHGFFDQMDRHFEADPSGRRGFDNSIVWCPRAEVAPPTTSRAFVAPSSDEEWRQATPVFPVGVSLSVEHGEQGQLRYSVGKPREYFHKPQPIAKEAYEYLHRLPAPAAAPVPEIRETLRALTRKRLLAWAHRP
jgi:SAM-dependent methyltransferase